MIVVIKIDTEKATKMREDGLSDKEIAAKLGCRAKSITNWRYRNDMPSNFGIFDWDKMGYEDGGGRNYSKHA